MEMTNSKPAKYDSSRAMEVEKNLLMKQIIQMPNLPTPSPIVMKLVQLLRYEEVQMKDIISSVERDQSLVAQLLKLINSGFYGLKNKVDSVETAVGLLGITNLKQVIYSATVIDLFSEEEKKEWEHAYSSSVLMTNIMRENELPVASNLPLTALIHDIGKVVLRKFRPQKYKLAQMASEEKRLPLFMAETTIINLNHAEIGGMIAEKWQMTPDISIPVAFHHGKAIPSEFILETALLRFVNWVDCTVRGITCLEPERDLMEAAGIEEIDKDYWINQQRAVVCTVRDQNFLEKAADTKKIPKQAPFRR